MVGDLLSDTNLTLVIAIVAFVIVALVVLVLVRGARTKQQGP
jgi:hypothetical protein